MKRSVVALLVLVRAAYADNSTSTPEDAAAESSRRLAFLIILSSLIVITIMFEWLRDKLEDLAKGPMAPIIDSLWKELSVLGFVGLLSFVLGQLDIFDKISLALLDDENGFDELFETVHMLLFVVMVIFILTALFLVVFAKRVKSHWARMEKLGKDMGKTVQAYTEALAESQRRRCNFRLPCFAVAHENPMQKAIEVMEYNTLRQCFVRPSIANEMAGEGGGENRKALAQDFRFHDYLSICLGKVLGDIVDVSSVSWVLLEILFVVLYFGFALPPAYQIAGFIGFGYLMVVGMVLIRRKVVHIRYMLLPILPEAKAFSLNGEEKAPLIDHRSPDFVPQYRLSKAPVRSKLGKCFFGRPPNPHEALFWIDRWGPRLLFFMIQFTLLLVSIYTAVFGFYFVGQILGLDIPAVFKGLIMVLAVIPIFVLTLEYIPYVICRYVEICNTEYLRKSDVEGKVARDQKTQKSLRAIKLLTMMNFHATMLAQKKVTEGETTAPTPTAATGVTVTENPTMRRYNTVNSGGSLESAAHEARRKSITRESAGLLTPDPKPDTPKRDPKAIAAAAALKFDRTKRIKSPMGLTSPAFPATANTPPGGIAKPSLPKGQGLLENMKRNGSIAEADSPPVKRALLASPGPPMPPGYQSMLTMPAKGATFGGPPKEVTATKVPAAREGAAPPPLRRAPTSDSASTTTVTPLAPRPQPATLVIPPTPSAPTPPASVPAGPTEPTTALPPPPAAQSTLATSPAPTTGAATGAMPQLVISPRRVTVSPNFTPRSSETTTTTTTTTSGGLAPRTTTAPPLSPRMGAAAAAFAARVEEQKANRSAQAALLGEEDEEAKDTVPVLAPPPRKRRHSRSHTLASGEILALDKSDPGPSRKMTPRPLRKEHSVSVVGRIFGADSMTKEKEENPEEERNLVEMFDLFSMFDRDGSGTISKDEIRQMMVMLGQKLEDKQLDAMMLSIDKDGNGNIDFEEFCQLMKGYQLAAHMDFDKSVEAIFKLFDTDNSGRITAAEFRDTVVKMDPSFSYADVEDLITEIDEDNDGEINIEEFAKLLKTHAGRNY